MSWGSTCPLTDVTWRSVWVWAESEIEMTSYNSFVIFLINEKLIFSCQFLLQKWTEGCKTHQVVQIKKRQIENATRKT